MDAVEEAFRTTEAAGHGDQLGTATTDEMTRAILGAL